MNGMKDSGVMIFHHIPISLCSLTCAEVEESWKITVVYPLLIHGTPGLRALPDVN